MANKVMIVMGSDSDFPIMEGCFKLLKEFGIEFEANVAPDGRMIGTISPKQIAH